VPAPGLTSTRADRNASRGGTGESAALTGHTMAQPPSGEASASSAALRASSASRLFASTRRNGGSSSGSAITRMPGSPSSRK